MSVIIFMFHLYTKFLMPGASYSPVVATKHKAKTTFPLLPYQYFYILRRHYRNNT